MQPNTRIAVNTAVIYVRLLVTIFVSLFSTRYVLLALGETNFGIYNLVAGVVALFSFISATMAGTTQRYVSYNMGLGDTQQVCNVFYNSCIIHITIAVVVALLVETAGLYLVNHVLTIPNGKLDDAQFVLHCVTIGLVFTVLTVPYEAVLMAHENILFVSLITILNSLIKFGGAIVLLYVSVNKLRLYAIIMAALPLICLMLQYFYCKKNYIETTANMSTQRDFALIKEMGGYAGWVIIGVTCGTIRTQGTAMLLNVFFGVIANAANGIAMQVNGVLQQFSASITTSIRPQLVKSVGENNMQRVLTLTYAACKYPSLLLALFAIPLVIAMPYVLELWLKDVPENASIFCTLLILVMLFNQLSMGLTTAIEAIGRVKILHLIVGSMHIVSIPAAYIFFKLGFPAPTIFWCIMVEEVIAALFRLILAKKLIGLSLRLFINEVLLRVLFVITTVVICGYYLWNVLPANLLNFIILCVSCTIVYILSMLIFGVNKTERIAIFRMISKGYTRIKTMM